MKKINILFLLFLFIGSSLVAQKKTVKNVIVLIPDGTSLPVVSAARWYQRYQEPDKTHLNLDAYLCGTILTYSSNAPIGDSAPTTSCYMTGYPSRAGWVSTYPSADPANDLVPMDPARAYQPLITLLEASRMVKNKSTGLVFTCEFPHATPADCSAHSYNRSKYDWIVPQMVHNRLDVVIGGGVALLKPELQDYLRAENYGVMLNDIDGFRTYQGDKMWALFRDKDMSYDIDRDPSKEPSLAEMTQKAIDKLSKNKNGFFLMVEGSKVDWAAHANDPIALMTDMLAFDKACGVAFDFAKRDGNTLVVVAPDHGNSGFSIGSGRCGGYSTMTKDQLWGPVVRFKTSNEGLINVLKSTDASQLKTVTYDLTGIDLSDDEYRQLLQCSDYNRSSLSDEERMKGSKLTQTVTEIIQNHLCFGFTTRGHTGEEVFLAVYDPRGTQLTGHHTNIELNHYMRKALGLENLEALTDAHFAKHSDVFSGYSYSITLKNDIPVLEVKNKKNCLEIRPNTNIVRLDGEEIKLNSVIVYVDKNKTFYLPQSLKKLLL
ncbi:MAG: alkaline phosphatase [Dysgonamonadaceae bacterium]|jgi:alkaline phosphatase|nr:alkaline phosphatase [Dysgonamonadaceae bacterium]